MPRNEQQAPDTTASPSVPGPRETGTEPPATTGPEKAQPEAARPGPATPPREHVVGRTRLSGVWAAIICFAVVLILLLIFIAENSRTVDISYMGAHGHLSLGVAMLIAAVCGALLVILAGTARILELRATARKHRRMDAKAAKAAPQR